MTMITAELQEGSLLEVSEVVAGSETAADHALGATQLLVYNANDFMETGGYLDIVVGALLEEAEDTIYSLAYSEYDEDTNFITLLDPLPVAIEADTEVRVAPYTTSKWALVDLDQEEDAIYARIPYSVSSQVEAEIREVLAPEAVTVELRGTEYVVIDFTGKEDFLDGALLDPETIPEPTESAPTAAPVLSAPLPGLDSVFLEWTDIAPSKLMRYEVHVSPFPSFTMSAATRYATVYGMIIEVTSMPDGTPMPYDEDTYFQVRAVTNGGGGPPSNEVFGRPLQGVDPAIIAEMEAAVAELEDVTIPALNSDLAAAQATLSDIETITLVQMNSDLSNNESAINTLNNTTIPQLQTDLDTAYDAIGNVQLKFPIQASDVGFDIGGGNLLLNSGMESTFNGSGVPESWFKSSGTWTPAQVGTTHRGAKAVSVTSTTGGQNWYLHQDVPVKPSTTYTASAWVYVPTTLTAGANSDRSILVIGVTNTGSYATDLSLGPAHPVGVWTRKVVTFTTAANETELRIRLHVPNGTVYWDSAQIEEGDIATAYAPRPDEILPGTITTTLIADDAITTPKLITGAVVAGKIAANAVTATEILAGAITTVKMTADSISGDRITANTLNASKIVAGSITSNEMTANTINGDRILANTLNAAKIVAGSITGDRIMANAITTEKLTVASTGDNLVMNPNFSDYDPIPGGYKPLVWVAGEQNTHTVELRSEYPGGQSLVMPSTAAGYCNVESNLFPVVELQTYAVEASAGYVGGGTPGFYLRVRWFNGSQVYMSYQDVVAGDNLSGYNGYAARKLIAGQLTAPSGARYGRVSLFNYPINTNSYILVNNVSTRRVTVSAQIADGAIITQKMTADTINGNVISGNTLQGAKIVGLSIYGGLIAGNTITGTNIAGTTITGSHIAGTTITGSHIAGNTITGTHIQGTAIDGKTITGALIKTAISGQRVEVSSSASGDIRFYNFSDALIGYIDAYAVGSLYGVDIGAGSSKIEMFNGGINIKGTNSYGISVQGGGMDVNGGLRLSGAGLNMGGFAISAVGSIAGGLTVSGGNIVISTSGSTLNTTNPPNVTTIPNARWLSGTGAGGNLQYTSHANSSIRYKDDLLSISEEFSVADILALPAYSYRWKEDAPGYMEGMDRQIGFIAEDMHEAGFGKWLGYEDGRPEEVDYAKWTLPLHVVAQNHEARIARLERKFATSRN